MVNSKIDRPNIFSYHDHRLFLPRWFDYLKLTQKKFSLRGLARDAEISTGYLPSVLSGKQRLSERALKKIIEKIYLTKNEQSFLLLMRTLTDTDDPKERLNALKRMQKYDAYQDLYSSETEAYRYWTHWFYPVIREMTALPDFVLDAEYIQSKLRKKVPLNQIKKAIRFLVDSKFIGVDSGGTISLPEKEIECMDGVHRISLGQFHREMFVNASDSIENTKSGERSLLGEVLAISQDDWTAVKDILEEARKKIAKLAHSKRDAEQIYHVALAAFPVTNNEMGDDDAKREE